MDPNACVETIDALISRGDERGAADAISDLSSWLSRGGSPPINPPAAAVLRDRMVASALENVRLAVVERLAR